MSKKSENPEEADGNEILGVIWLTVFFLKLVGLTSISWWWIWSPFLLAAAIAAVVWTVIGIVWLCNK